ncbi:hypothetical protein FisN_12Lh178 [Fistulifera solaris]|uniref:Uncharacterized protein n=1 Tax=Fistulifera solaris TaxID=1519565 RepID=A0A1Z5JMI6_FISSO|nr:hypothetical protein FisN_12Lh178 [Fistulifera solaris]|eukprot:GAX15126.1 hypothetical protein FisN_12Lh178 [Fistulifera solaris]
MSGSSTQSTVQSFSIILTILLACWTPSSSFVPKHDGTRRSSETSCVEGPKTPLHSSFVRSIDDRFNQGNWENNKQKFKRKRIPKTEIDARQLRQQREEEYERLVTNADSVPSIWNFESLFPSPIIDEESVDRDLFEIQRRDRKKEEERNAGGRSKIVSNPYAGETTNPFLRLMWSEPTIKTRETSSSAMTSLANENATAALISSKIANTTSARVDRSLTRMVEDRIYGFRRGASGDIRYQTSLMGDGAVQYREGVRLGNALPINADRLNYMAKKEMKKGRVEEAEELYERAVEIDPRDGRAYLGLSRCAQRRQDFKLAREWLNLGIANSASTFNGNPDRGANPFLLQALGCLEEKAGQLSQAESLYTSAVRSRPSHAAGWVALAQIRTRKLGQSVGAGRSCFEAAERELKASGLPQSSHVYTAWADLELKKAGDARRAKKLLKMALEIDPKCSVGWLQLGMLESDLQNWDKAEECFENVLTFDQRNSRVLQAYAIMETKRPDGNSRKAIGLFERALKANPRDAGVLQAYGLYVAKLGDIKSARELLWKGTEVDKRHAPIWQALGVLETRSGNPEEARSIFQQGIWACAQLTGCKSGGHNCARLWQAWGVLEAEEGNHAAARRCFNRALDADSRNVPAITAWSSMEEKLGNRQDARAIYERALPRFSAGSESKKALWRNYELMEQRAGDTAAAQRVYQRAIREVISFEETSVPDQKVDANNRPQPETTTSSRNKREKEVVRWNGGGGEVWLNDRAIEAKIPSEKRESRYEKTMKS